MRKLTRKKVTMQIKEKPKKEFYSESFLSKLASTVRILENKGRLVIKNVLIQHYPTFGVDKTTSDGALVDSLVLKGYPHFKKVSTHDGPSGYPTHFEFVFYGFQVKDLPKEKEILDLVGSDKMIQLDSKLEYQYLLDVLTYHFESGKYRGKYFVKPNFIEGEPKTFPISIELLSKEGFYKSEIIIQLAK